MQHKTDEELHPIAAQEFRDREITEPPIEMRWSQGEAASAVFLLHVATQHPDNQGTEAAAIAEQVMRGIAHQDSRRDVLLRCKPFQAFALLAHLQLALRAPQLPLAHRITGHQLARRIQATLPAAEMPATAELAERGWRSIEPVTIQ